MPKEKKVLTHEELEAKRKAQEFNKSINKIWKLRSYKIKGSQLNDVDLGKAPKCNTKVKTERPVEMANQKKKKK